MQTRMQSDRAGLQRRHISVASKEVSASLRCGRTWLGGRRCAVRPEATGRT